MSKLASNSPQNKVGDETQRRPTPTVEQRVLGEAGAPIPLATRLDMQSRFGRDFSGVRLHTDIRAQQSTRRMNAAAYSFGNHIVFNEPHLANRGSLLAHELTHVAQTSGGANPSSARVNESVSRESEANANAAAYANGGAISVRQSTTPSIQRLKLGEPKKLNRGEDSGSIWSRFKQLLDNLGAGFWDLAKTLASPSRFLDNLRTGIGGGFESFIKNIRKHVKTGLMSWLLGAMGKTGIQLPKEFTPQSVFGLAVQVMKLTYLDIRAKIAKLVGEKNVQRVEKLAGVAEILARDGVAGLWDHLKEQLTTIKDTVVNGIREFVLTKVVVAGIKKVLLWLNPAGAILAAVEGVYKFYDFFKSNAGRLADLFSTIVSGVKSIVKGNVGGVAKSVEGALARGVTLMIDLVAKLIGLGGVGKRVRELIDKIRQPVHNAVDGWIAKAVGIFNARKSKRRGGKAKTKGKMKGKKQPQHSAKKQKLIEKGLADFRRTEKPFLDAGKIEGHEAQRVADTIRRRHKVFSSFTVERDGKNWKYEYAASDEKTAGVTPNDVKGKQQEATHERPWAWGNSKSKKYHVAKSAQYKRVDEASRQGAQKSHWVALTEKQAKDLAFSPAAGSTSGEQKNRGLPKAQIMYATDNGLNNPSTKISRARVVAMVGYTKARQGLEEALPAVSGFHRAHLFGPILGGEAVEGIMYTPPTTNLSTHKKIENRIKRLKRRYQGAKGDQIHVSASVVSHSANDVGGLPRPNRYARRYDYSLTLYRPGKAGVSSDKPLGSSAKPVQIERVKVTVPLPAGAKDKTADADKAKGKSDSVDAVTNDDYKRLLNK